MSKRIKDSLSDIGIEPVAVSVKNAARIMATSRATIYRRQGEVGYPKIYKDGARSKLLYEEVKHHTLSLQPKGTQV